MTTVMMDKVVLITGANSGIGFCAARDLAGKGARVVLACRRPEAADDAMAAIRVIHPHAQLDSVQLDVSSLESVRTAAAEILERFPTLDVLVNNAGVAKVRREESVDGFEMTLATNHLGPFLLTNLLLQAVKSPGGRIINVASVAHTMGKIHFDDLNLTKGYRVMRAYSQSKLANMLFTRALAKRLDGAGVTVNALHPGAVNTNIWPGNRWYEKVVSSVIRLFTISADEGSRTTTWLASAPELEGETGGYYQDCKPQKTKSSARDDNAAEQLWAVSEKMVGLSAA
ncbi:SDR family oxidoreductase [Marinobacter caseinilyticus]|uniref:SDR family oxidoreductase n=1 Tax=Marinobacter caseinilyticus TaxID=2692195 RepID=UPI001A947BF4|nr:SDR family oxidoreductase [Marinobacter caseinilyticus]